MQPNTQHPGTNPMQPDRNTYVGGSDAYAIIKGDWHALWELKTGRRQADDLSSIFKVQLGIFTESFNADWFAQTLNLKVYRDVEFVTDGCRGGHVDGLVGDRGILECKHTYSFNTTDKLLNYYYPQIMHYLSLYPERDHVWLSVIKGNDWTPLRIERDDEYIKNLVQMEHQFWDCVTSDREPCNLEEELPVDPIKITIDNMISVDMSSSNSWAEHANIYLKNKAAADDCAKSKTALRKMVEANVRHAEGHGVKVTRSKSGSLTVKGI